MFQRAAVFLLAAVLGAAAQTMPPGITRTQLADNASVMVARLRMAPGAREELHTHPFSAVVVQIDPGEVEMRVGTRRETVRRDTGHVEFIAAEMPHAAANTGAVPFDVVTIALKPDRKPGATQPPSETPVGITRTPVIDNPQARATRVTFGPGSREAVHTHPYDLVLVQLSPGRMELVVGEKKDVKTYEAGDIVFLPRDVPHAAASADQRPFDLLSVGIK